MIETGELKVEELRPGTVVWIRARDHFTFDGYLLEDLPPEGGETFEVIGVLFKVTEHYIVLLTGIQGFLHREADLPLSGHAVLRSAIEEVKVLGRLEEGDLANFISRSECDRVQEVWVEAKFPLRRPEPMLRRSGDPDESGGE